MTDLDPATLEKFQRFQAMLAASPEIVEALNSPEILALAAKRGALPTTPKAQPTPLPPPPPPEPEPEYPMVGYGVSDDVSVLSEMTTPTVMTRQTVEEDEFYPEVNGQGQSSSGMGCGPRRIGLRIGITSTTEEGQLPPPPPKSKGRQMRHGRMGRKSRAMAAPMSKIVENGDAVSVNNNDDDDKDNNNNNNNNKNNNETDSTTDEEADERKPPSRKGSWTAIERGSKKQVEPHPFFGSVGVGTVSRPARHNGYNTRARRIKGRGVNRNRSMPTNMQRTGTISNSTTTTSGSSNGDEVVEDDPSSEFFSNGSSHTTAVGSDSTPVNSKNPENEQQQQQQQQQQPTTQKVRSKASKSPRVPKERGFIRSRSMPLKMDGNSTNTSTEAPMKIVDGAITSGSSHSLSEGDEESIPDKESATTEKPKSNLDNDDDPPIVAKDGRNSFLNAGEKTPRTKNTPRMRLVPVVSKSVASAESSPARLTANNLESKKPRSRSLSKYSNRNLRDKIRSGNSSSEDEDDDHISRSSAPVSSKSLTQEKKPSTKQTKPRSRSLSKYSNRNLRDNLRSVNLTSSEDDEDDHISRSSAPVSSKSLTKQKKLSTKQKKPRSRSLSNKYPNRKSRGDNSNDDGDNGSRSSAPIKSTESVSSKSLTQQKDRRGRSLSKSSKRNLRESHRGNSSCDDDDENVSRSSATLTASSNHTAGTRSSRKPKRLSSLTKHSYRVSTDGDDDDHSSQPSLPLRNPDSGDESDDIDSVCSDTKTDSCASSTSSVDEKERRPSVLRRWRPPSIDNSALPPAFRLSGSNHSGRLSTSNHSGKLSTSNHSGRLSTSNHSGKFSTSNHSHKSSEGTKPLKKGRKPAPLPKATPYGKASSGEQKETRTEEQHKNSSSHSEEDYVPQTVRKHGKSKNRETEKSPPRPTKENPQEFQQHFAELTQVIQGNTSRPSDYLASADGAFSATRKKRVQPKTKNLGTAVTAAPRASGWLGSGTPKKRTWKVKGVKPVS